MDEMNIFETAPSFPVIPLRGLVMFRIWCCTLMWGAKRALLR